jgi:Lrp/AsnC family leucine-responsive transcriptional regulator
MSTFMKQEALDATDLRLLDLLQSDASRNNQELAALAHVSPPTSLRRIKRLRELGVIEREVALLQPDRLAPMIGSGLTALVEVSLERQSAEYMDSFEAHVLPDPAVQQCYRVSPGPDFMLVVHTTDMPAYLALAQRLFTASANVRNVKAFFSHKRAKFDPRLPLSPAP